MEQKNGIGKRKTKAFYFGSVIAFMVFLITAFKTTDGINDVAQWWFIYQLSITVVFFIANAASKFSFNLKEGKVTTG